MRPFGKRALVALAAFAVAIAAAEWAVGRWFPVRASLYQLDPVLVYVPRPGARCTKIAGPERARHWVTTEINAQGHRGPEFELVKTRPRAVVYGDSFVLAEDVEERDSFVARLRAQFAATGPCEVVNSGVTGYGPDQQLLKFEREDPALRPDLVVFVLYASNDFGDLIRNKMFRVDELGHAVKNAYTLAPSLVADFERRAHEASGPALVRAVRGLLDARRIEPDEDPNDPYMEIFLRACAGEYDEYALQGNLAIRYVWEDHYDADVALQPDLPASVYKRALLRAVVERMRDECARRGVAMLALIVPSAVDLCPKGQIHVDPARYPSWSPSRLTNVIETIVNELGIPHVNLYEPFVAAGPDDVYIGDGNLHWNEAGQELAAQRVATFAREHALWPPARRR